MTIQEISEKLIFCASGKCADCEHIKTRLKLGVEKCQELMIKQMGQELRNIEEDDRK